MVTTSREQEVVLLEPGNQSNDPQEQEQQYGFILVVEDDTPTLRLERVILEEAGYSVEVVGSGEEAVEFIAEKSPTLVLLDIGLPGMDGFATCAKIRELSRVPIIMVTGRDCLDDKVRGMDVGADDYVTKPFLTHELATRVKVVLRRTTVSIQDEKDSLYFKEVSQEISAPQVTPVEPPTVTSEPEPVEPEPTPQAETPVAETPVEEATAPQESLSEEQEEPVSTGEGSLEEPSDDPAPVEAPVASRPSSLETGIYEGTVQLTVTALGPVRNLINFVSELRQNPQFRLLRLVANQHKEGMDIWLGLREPLELVEILSSMAGVHEVLPDKDLTQEEEQLLVVTLD